MKKKPKSERQFITRKHSWNESESSNFRGVRLFFMTACYVPFLFINLYNLLSKCCWLFNPLKFLFNSCSLKIVIDDWNLSDYETVFKCKVQFFFNSRLLINREIFIKFRLFSNLSFANGEELSTEKLLSKCDLFAARHRLSWLIAGLVPGRLKLSGFVNKFIESMACCFLCAAAPGLLCMCAVLKQYNCSKLEQLLRAGGRCHVNWMLPSSRNVVKVRCGAFKALNGQL